MFLRIAWELDPLAVLHLDNLLYGTLSIYVKDSHMKKYNKGHLIPPTLKKLWMCDCKNQFLFDGLLLLL